MLTLTRKSGYALIALAYLSEPDNIIVSAREIAKRYDLPLRLLMNVMKQLGRAGLVKSVRGANGGYTLAVKPEEITLRKLIGVMEGPIELAQCLTFERKKKKCNVVKRCPLRAPIHIVQEKLENFLDSITLADIVENKYDVTDKLSRPKITRKNRRIKHNGKNDISRQ